MSYTEYDTLLTMLNQRKKEINIKLQDNENNKVKYDMTLCKAYKQEINFLNSVISIIEDYKNEDIAQDEAAERYLRDCKIECLF